MAKVLSLLATKMAVKEPGGSEKRKKITQKSQKNTQLGQPKEPRSWSDLYSGKSGRAGSIPLLPERRYLHTVIIRHY